MSLRKNAPSTRLIPIFSMLLRLGILLYALAALVTPAQAAPAFQEDKPTNDFCLACHQEEGIDKTLGKESPFLLRSTRLSSRTLFMLKKVLTVWIAILISVITPIQM